MKTLKSVSQQEVLSVFNKSFSDYFVSLQLSEKQFFEKLISNNIDFSLSVGAFENNKLVGFILHGVNAKSVYNSGTGVIPKRRGFGLTIRMYKFILPILKSNQISKVVLEVITENIQAIKSYKKVGFLTR
ncbi:MAG: GNAT family N-acetyltransferase, partial [Flavobacteriales bacterium]